MAELEEQGDRVCHYVAWSPCPWGAVLVGEGLWPTHIIIVRMVVVVDGKIHWGDSMVCAHLQVPDLYLRGLVLQEFLQSMFLLREFLSERA